MDKCRKCGACCYRVFPFMRVPIGKSENIPEDMIEEIDGVRHLKTKEDRSCIALDAKRNRCTIYKNRPFDCKAFEPVDALCEVLRYERIKGEL
jgi:Fe-S-cluster containining protein